MAGPTIDEAFEIKFNRDVHLAYQQKRLKFRSLVRTDADVQAEKVRFQKIGTIEAGTKARNGRVNFQNPEHTYVEVTMEDNYASVMIDKLDLTKLSIDVRGGYVTSMAAALARKTDKQIIDAMIAGATQTVGTYTGNLTANLCLEAREALDDAEVDDDARVFCAVTPRMWSHLMKIDEFSKAENVGYDQMPWRAPTIQQMRMWNRTYWFTTNRYPGIKTATCKAYMWHQAAIGHGINSEVSTTWGWENPEQAWSGVSSMSMNAVVIDPLGLVEIRVDDTAALPA